MNYNEAQNYIEEKNRLGMVPGLMQVKELLIRLGNPQNACRTLHIAGTNGKGSVFAFVQEGLLAAGYHVGRYISPTIFTYLERFQIDKISMTKQEFAMYITRVSEVIAQMERDGFASPTAFEIETSIAFLYFKERNVDYVLLECGMGGRLDATNVLEKAEITVFSQISMDHMQFLGDTIADIAREKAGIIKPGTYCISAPQKREVSDVLSEASKKWNVSYEEICEENWKTISMDLAGSTFSDGEKFYTISMLGEHQIINAQTAICVLRNLAIDDGFIREGLARTSWPGRLTRIQEKPYIFVDGAHNEAAWRYLRLAVQKYFTNRRIIYIIGVLKDKEYDKMVEILAPTMARAVTITPATPRGLPKEVLAHLLEAKHVPTDMAQTSAEAMRIALRYAAKEDVILVCGSLSFLSDYLSVERNGWR
ncbi:MAG: bifunctional folylpolyglutamate synthase/dihydrofolate synthase [Wujia sp.]